MRLLMSTFAAAALSAAPSLAQTPTEETSDAPTMAGEEGQVASEGMMHAPDFANSQELQGAEIYTATFDGEQAIIVVTDGFAGPGMDQTADPTAAQPEDPEGEEIETATEMPAEPEGAAQPEDPAAPPEMAQDSGEAGVDTDVAEGDVTAPSAQSLSDVRSASGARVFQSTTGDGRTVLIFVGAELAGQSGSAGADN